MIEFFAMTEEFFTTYENTAWAFFTTFAFILTLGRIATMMRKNADENAAKIVAAALIDQRQIFQSQYIDIQEKRYEDAVNALISNAENSADVAIKSAICMKILDDNNIKPWKDKT